MDSDWFKHQILRNLRKAACMLIPRFLTNFLITKSRLSLSNTVNFSWLLFATLMIARNLLTKKTPFKMEFKYI